MQFVDTHAHIQFNDYKLDPEEVLGSAVDAGVSRMLIVGCDLESSINAVAFSKHRDEAFPAVGVHPHNAKKFHEDVESKRNLEELITKNPEIVAIGEFGLDYYDNSPRETQLELLKYQLKLVKKYNKPGIFHIRDAFADFWPLYDEYSKDKIIPGVVHCFTATQNELDEALSRGLYVALNGIMTFTKNPRQLEAAKAVPLDRLLLETDAPFLTPAPFRGKICEPKHVVQTAEFLSGLRGESIELIASETTKNAKKLFNIR